MKSWFTQITTNRLALLCVILSPMWLASQAQTSLPVVVSARMEKGGLVYKVNGKTVEDNKDNSLITNLARIAKLRGSEVPVFIIVDVRASFIEVGKLETALDKVELNHSRRLFVTDFHDSTMNEIHWDQTPIPIPSNSSAKN
jgi:hypothetical protein